MNTVYGNRTPEEIVKASLPFLKTLSNIHELNIWINGCFGLTTPSTFAKIDKCLKKHGISFERTTSFMASEVIGAMKSYEAKVEAFNQTN